MVRKKYSQLPPGVEEALGRFIANFSLLEEWIRGVILEIPNVSAPAGEILTSQLSFQELLNVFGAIIHEYVDNPDILRLTDDTVREINKANEVRNQFVHSVWLCSDESPRHFAVYAKSRANRKKGFQDSWNKVRKQDISKKCKEVAELTNKVREIYEMITEQYRAPK